MTTYTYDPLDRTTSKTEKEGPASAKTTTYSYLGLSGEVLDEEVAGKRTESFQYSPWGERLSQVKVTATGGGGVVLLRLQRPHRRRTNHVGGR
ncbi:hypothetical protein [Nonomuraea dietziae]|uniref:hypothetical protein n=1 Tax=Nonomuraea dietziae TaxID=65515 RepID=UPI00343444D4